MDDVAQDFADAELEKVPSDPHAAASISSPLHVFGADNGAQPAQFKPETSTQPPKFTYGPTPYPEHIVP